MRGRAAGRVLPGRQIVVRCNEGGSTPSRRHLCPARTGLVLASGHSRKGAAHQVGNLFHPGDVKKTVIETHTTLTTFAPQHGKVDIASPPFLGDGANEF